MFSVRLCLAVAGVLFVSDTILAKEAVRGTKDAISRAYLREAYTGNRKALKFFNALEEAFRDGAKNTLLDVQADLIALLKYTATDRLVTLTNALAFELQVRDMVKYTCKDVTGCERASAYIQKSTVSIIATIEHEITDEEKKAKIEKLYRDLVSKEATLTEEQLEEDTYSVGMSVLDVLYEEILVDDY